jgi:hypothetical protein
MITKFWDAQKLLKLKLHIKCIAYLFNFVIINFSLTAFPSIKLNI